MNEESQKETIGTTEETEGSGKAKKRIAWKKPTKRQMEKFILNFLFIVIGNAITAAASAFFIVPNHFVMGGTTGLGIFVENMLTKNNVSGEWTYWAVEITVYVANIFLFVLGAVLLGKKFALATGAGTFLYPTFMSLFKFANDAYVEAYGHPVGMPPEAIGQPATVALGSPFFAMLCGGMLFGLGIGLVLRVGASTGGTDIPPLIFKKFFNAPVSVTMWIVDFSIVALNLIAAPLDSVLYGVFITLISAIVVDKVTPIGMKRMQVKIISMHYKEIRDMIITKVSRGVTVLYGQTGYLKQPCHMLLTVVSSRQLVTLKSEVQKIDPNAFMTISVVSEVKGRGFQLEGVDFLMKQERDDASVHLVEDPADETDSSQTP